MIPPLRLPSYLVTCYVLVTWLLGYLVGFTTFFLEVGCPCHGKVTLIKKQGEALKHMIKDHSLLPEVTLPKSNFQVTKVTLAVNLNISPPIQY